MRAEHYYKDVPGYFDWEPVYEEAISWIPNGGLFVEVGCWQGMSLSFLLVEAFNSGKKIKVLGVDHFRGSVNDSIQQEANIKSIGAHCMHNLRRASYPFGIIKADSTYGCEFVPDGGADYVFIDGSHDYESVASDLRAWMPKVRSGGILAGHDFNSPDVEKAVREAVGSRRVEVIVRPKELGGCVWGTCWRVQL